MNGNTKMRRAQWENVKEKGRKRNLQEMENKEMIFFFKCRGKQHKGDVLSNCWGITIVRKIIGGGGLVICFSSKI